MAISDGVSAVWMPARPHWRRPRLSPRCQLSPRGHDHHWWENNKVIFEIMLKIAFFTSFRCSHQSVLLLTRLIILDAFRFCGRAAGMQIAAHIKTQVLKYFPPPSSGLPWPKVTFFQLGWMAIFGLNFVLIAANLVYILLYVKDKKKPAAAGTSSGDCLQHLNLIALLLLVSIMAFSPGCIEVATSILASYPNLVFR